MLYCPECRTEYRDGFDTCANCHVPLVAELPPLPPFPPLPPTVDFGDPVLLQAVNNELEADMMLALLAENHIPAYKKYLAAGGYLSIYMGITSFGTKVYVPQQLLEQAREIVEVWQTQSEDDAEQDEMDEYLLRRRRKGKIFPLFWLLYFFLGLLWGGIMSGFGSLFGYRIISG